MLVRLRASPQAKKKWAELPEQFEARLLTRTVNGKERQVLTLAHRPAALPGQRVDGAIPESLGNRAGLSGDET